MQVTHTWLINQDYFPATLDYQIGVGYWIRVALIFTSRF